MNYKCGKLSSSKYYELKATPRPHRALEAFEGKLSFSLYFRFYLRNRKK